MSIELFGFQAGPYGFVQYGLEPEAKPYLFLRANCGRGAGKTFAGGCRTVAYCAKFPGAEGMAVGLTTDKVRDTLLPSLRDVCRQFGMREGTDYEYNKTERLWTFLGSGSRIYMRSAEEPESLPGANLAFFWLDEYRKMPFRVWEALVPTLRQKGFPPQAWITSTPAGKNHWSRRIWFPKTYAAEFDCEVYPRGAGEYISYKAGSIENPNNPPEFFSSLIATYGENTALAKQELWGEEILMNDLVYSVWDRQVHVVPREDWPGQPKYILAGVDFGFANPSCVLVGGCDEEGRIYLLDMFYKRGVSPDTLIGVAKRLDDEYGLEVMMCDSSDPGRIQQMREHGLPAYPAKRVVGERSDPSAGIGAVHAAIIKQVNGEQGFFVDKRPSMLPFFNEIENYVVEETTDKANSRETPRKKNDHAMDAFKYLIQGINRFYMSGDAASARMLDMEYVA